VKQEMMGWQWHQLDHMQIMPEGQLKNPNVCAYIFGVNSFTFELLNIKINIFNKEQLQK